QVLSLALSLPRASHSEAFHGLAIAAKKQRSLQQSLTSFLLAPYGFLMGGPATGAVVCPAHDSRISSVAHLLPPLPAVVRTGWQYQHRVVCADDLLCLHSAATDDIDLPRSSGHTERDKRGIDADCIRRDHGCAWPGHAGSWRGHDCGQRSGARDPLQDRRDL